MSQCLVTCGSIRFWVSTNISCNCKSYNIPSNRIICLNSAMMTLEKALVMTVIRRLYIVYFMAGDKVCSLSWYPPVKPSGDPQHRMTFHGLFYASKPTVPAPQYNHNRRQLQYSNRDNNKQNSDNIRPSFLSHTPV